ncbi:MAG: hydrolase [Ignavibacteriae bacterium]|nr:MAG: hydrolase [Ignavibacteriota bacterium]
MLKQKELKQISVKERVELFLLLTNIIEKETKNGKKYLDLVLRDKSTSINAKKWDNFDEFVLQARAGNIVKVLGTMDEFNNQPQIKIDKIRITAASDNVSIEDFLPKSSRNFTEMENELNSRIERIENKCLKRIIKEILSKDNFEKYKKVPAGKAWHHAYIGGLLEHTLEIVKICDLMCDIHPEVNRDLVISGAILHDLGKIEELEITNGFEYTNKGKLLGHIVIVANLIEKAAVKISDFPEWLKDQLLHLVLSHQGKLEYASPVVPKTLEAIILYHADELSAKTNAYKSAIIAETTGNTNWTRYLPLAETSLYIPKDFGNTNEFKETLF